MSLLLIGGVASLGYWLSRNGKANRLTKESVHISERDRPMGPTIYGPTRMGVPYEIPPLDASANRNPYATYNDNEVVGAPFKQFSQQYSHLTGQMVDMSHGNMQPHFGASKRQTSASMTTRTLEAFGVVPEETAVKTETLNSSLIPQDRSAGLSLVGDRTLIERTAGDLSQTRHDLSLSQAARDTPTVNETIRIIPKTTDELRRVDNPLVEYEGVMIRGKMGHARTMGPSEVKKNPYDYYSKEGTRALMPDLSSRQSQRAAGVEHFVNQDRDREGIEMPTSFFGPPIGQRRSADDSNWAAMADTLCERPETKRDKMNPSFAAPKLSNPVGPMNTTFAVPLGKRDQKNRYLPSASSAFQRPALEPEMDVPTTAREINSECMYLGPGHTGLNLPATVQDYDIGYSSKELLLQDDPHFGNASAHHKQGARSEDQEWTQDLPFNEHENRMSSGFAPIGQAVRTTKHILTRDREQQVPRLSGGKGTTTGRPQISTTLKEDGKTMELNGPNRKQVSFGTSPNFPVITKTREKESLNLRNDLVRPSSKLSREFGRLPQIMETEE